MVILYQLSIILRLNLSYWAKHTYVLTFLLFIQENFFECFLLSDFFVLSFPWIYISLNQGIDFLPVWVLGIGGKKPFFLYSVGLSSLSLSFSGSVMFGTSETRAIKHIRKHSIRLRQGIQCKIYPVCEISHKHASPENSTGIIGTVVQYYFGTKKVNRDLPCLNEY